MNETSIKGLDLSERFWNEVGKPAFAKKCPAVLEKAAVGLVGEGSECFGFDDAISRDHDWGPGFCIWLTKEDFAAIGAQAQRIYAALPAEFEGFTRLRVSEYTAGRVGVQEIGNFYARYTGLDHPPESLREWRFAPEKGLSVTTNGRVFQDPTGDFSRFRTALLEFYPEDLRRKKLAAVCAVAAQAGQYNYARCMRRGETVAAMQALGEFVHNAMRAIFLLNRRYMPYYKWNYRALCDLPLLGGETAPLFQAIAEELQGREARIEEVSALIIAQLRRQGLSGSGSDFLLHHAEEVQRGITDPMLQKMHLMAE